MNAYKSIEILFGLKETNLPLLTGESWVGSTSATSKFKNMYIIEFENNSSLK